LTEDFPPTFFVVGFFALALVLVVGLVFVGLVTVDLVVIDVVLVDPFFNFFVFVLVVDDLLIALDEVVLGIVFVIFYY
jgi:hypothetical protein